MKAIKLIFFFILITTFTYSVYSQTQSRTERRGQKLKEFLSLSDEQTTKITDILSKYDQKTTQEQSTKQTNKKAMRKNMMKRLAEMDKEIEPLLTPEQLKKYESYKKEQRNAMKSRSKGKKFRED
jgi:Spy/CpxP family protein refolding chaperone